MFRIETGVDRRRRDLLRSRLQDTNAELSPVIRALRGTQAEREVALQIWVMEESAADGPDVPAAGLDGHTWAGWLHIDLLWVDSRHRGTGLGSRLLAHAERTALEQRDCVNSRVSTWEFQAPAFYRKYGYEVVCAIPDYPPGITEYTLTKRLR